MTKEEKEMVALVRESDFIDKTSGSDLAKAFNYLFNKYIEGALNSEYCEDAISRQMAIAEIYDKYMSSDMTLANPAASECIKIIKDLPSVRPTRLKGKWMPTDNPLSIQREMAKCSVCGSVASSKRIKYCPDCGADMRESENKE